LQHIFNEEYQHACPLHFLKNFENRVAWFIAELCKAEKGVQKDK
jgi:hypothetical protein